MEIAQSLLQRSEQALFSGDFSAFVSMIMLPFTHESYTGVTILQTEEDLKAFFKTVVNFINLHNVTAYHRDLISATFTSETEIKYTYVTRRLSGHMLVGDAYPNISTARQTGGTWKIATAQHATENTPEFRATQPKALRDEPKRPKAP